MKKNAILQKDKNFGVLKKKLLVINLLILFAIVLVLIGSLFKSIEGDIHIITLTENGFMPNTITIKEGDAIRFENKLDRPFWPASDVHPTHEIYSEFDPGKPVEVGDSWEFTFDKEGEWNFHDHLASLNQGLIIVGGSESFLSHNEASFEECDKNNSVLCWNELIGTALREQGVDAGFEVFAKAFNTNSSFAEDCHGYTHLLGEVGYKNYSNNEEFPVTDKLAYCSYGFFHGFIEAMMQDQGSLKNARELCDYLDKSYKDTMYVIGPCLHGIGHGVTDGEDPQAYGDPWGIIDPGLELCETIARDEYEDKICATGVFNALAILYAASAQGLDVDKDDPFEICRSQKKEIYKHACFDDFKGLIMHLTDNNFVEAARFIEEIDGDTFAQGAIDNLATFYVYFLLKEQDYKVPISECYSLQERLHADCISGLGAGFLTAGKPGVEYVRALELCSQDLIAPVDRDACNRRVIRLIRLRYTPDKYREICKGVEREFEHYCAYYERSI